MKGSPRHGGPCAMGAPLLAAALAAALVTGCGGGRRAGSVPPETTGPDSPAASAGAVEVCTSLVSYWAEQALEGSRWAGLDWEQKGFSNEQLTIHDEILAAARAERRRHGPAAAKELIRRQSKARCTAAHGATGSSENWRAPEQVTIRRSPADHAP
ncbi:hypothetical protein [Streptomyces sp. NPDC018031]|uniref:hypothetical protein n=1 Tax=Streptomyces sp. NPDC018031 TaxID=3365033 RepID=UPI00379CC585